LRDAFITALDQWNAYPRPLAAIGSEAGIFVNIVDI
jgi:hypothetical protein